VLIINSVNENILVYIYDDEIKDDESIYSIIETDEVENDILEEESSANEMNLIDEIARLKVEMMNQVECEHVGLEVKEIIILNVPYAYILS
jgi:hypothetical protein